jgi:hypothetical protein
MILQKHRYLDTGLLDAAVFFFFPKRYNVEVMRMYFKKITEINNLVLF